MANEIEQLEFADAHGLTALWSDIQKYLTRMYGDVLAGWQISRVYQKDGQLHVLVEQFGGATEERKAESRKNLGVYSKDEIDGLVEEKADKVSHGVEGNFAALGNDGNLVDSGINLMDVITGVSIMLDDGGISTKQSLVSGHEAILEETTDAEVSRILAALH